MRWAPWLADGSAQRVWIKRGPETRKRRAWEEKARGPDGRQAADKELVALLVEKQSPKTAQAQWPRPRKRINCVEDVVWYIELWPETGGVVAAATSQEALEPAAQLDSGRD